MLFRKHVDIDGESVIAGRHFRAAWSSAAMQDRHALDGAKTRLAALKKYDRQYRQTQEACVLVVVRSGFDLHRHHLTRPAVLERLGGIPDSLLWILDLVKQGTEMEPW